MILLLLGLALGMGTQADQVYKWVDAQGNVHYSDKPHQGAQKIKVAPPQSYSASVPPAAGREGGNRRPQPVDKAVHYTLTIVSPKPEQTIRNTRSVTVSVQVSPGLGPGDHLSFQLDGQSRGPESATSVTFDDLDRGQHTVSATLTTASGQTIQAGPVTFYLHQATVFHAKPPQ